MLLSGMFKFMSLMYGYYFDPKSTDKTPTPKLKHHWAYDGDDGPSTWPLHYEICGRRRQSPINIVENQLDYDPGLSKVQLYNFDVFSQMTGNTILNITNNGHSASCAIKGDFYVDGGGLGGHYRTAEFHFHWGAFNSRGSEHALTGKKYPLEMHIVNYAEKYGNLSSAMKESDGLAVLGVFFEVSPRDNPALEPIMSALGNIVHNGDYNVIDNCSVRALLPGDLGSFYRYEGSLTTPPCYESVIWTVFAETQYISERQLNVLRSLEQHQHDTHGPNGKTTKGRKRMVDNFRPLQKLNRRRVQKSFRGNYVRQPSNTISSPSFPSASNVGGRGSITGSGLKDQNPIFSAVQDAQKLDMLLSGANAQRDPKAAARQTQQTLNEQKKNVQLPSVGQVGGARPSKSLVTLINGPFLPPLNVGEMAPSVSSSSSPKLSSLTAPEVQPNRSPNPVITSGALEKVSSSSQSVSSSKARPTSNSRPIFIPPPTNQQPQLQQPQPQPQQWNNNQRVQPFLQTNSQTQQSYPQWNRNFNTYPQQPPPVYLQPSPQPVRVRNPFYYNYNINNNNNQQFYNSNNYAALNFGALGELKKRKRRTSRRRKSRTYRHHVHDENCRH